MIKINLMPPELIAARSKKEAVTLPWREIGIAVAVGAVVISIGLPLENLRRSRELKRLQAEWETLEPKKERLTELQQSVQQLQRQADALQTAKNKQARWAPRLALISDAVVPQVWLTRLEYVQGKSLRVHVQGTALVGSGGDVDGGGHVTRFLQQLKEQPGFQDWFGSVELKSVEHRHIKEEEVADFVLLLTPPE
ncbi:MAG: hypothetical protein Q7J69_03565 [Candidatus Omnitrophota bacterium]|nr:hypothetical protein [Candidatus Omnitrophota bacterium]